MALVITTSAGESDADSYISLTDARAYAIKYGFSLSDDDTEAEVSLRLGAKYVDLKENGFCGSRLVDDQALAWPRTESVNTYGKTIAAGTIPVQLGYAQVYAAYEFSLGTDVRASDDGKSISSEEVTGAVAVSYFNNGKTGSIVEITKCLDALAPLLACSNAAMTSGLEFRVNR